MFDSYPPNMKKFLVFKKEYTVKSKKDFAVGHIFFHKPWKKWVFEPAYDEIMLDAECLRDIAEFMEKLK